MNVAGTSRQTSRSTIDMNSPELSSYLLWIDPSQGQEESNRGAQQKELVHFEVQLWVPKRTNSNQCPELSFLSWASVVPFEHQYLELQKPNIQHFTT